MEFPEWDARPCGLSVRTDSLTILLDLSRIPAPVGEAFRQVLQIPHKSSGIAISPSNGISVTRAARAQFESLWQSRPDQALQFATLLSAFFHEVRHVHDLRATWIGAELLLNDYKVYAGVQKVLEDLLRWQQIESSRRILMPLRSSIDEHSLDSSFPTAAIRLSLVQAELVSKWWEGRSRFRTIPGTSIRELFEALGFIIQIEWLADTFGQQVTDEIVHKTLGNNPQSSPYIRSIYLLGSHCARTGAVFDPEPHDIATLIVECLNVSGLEEAFSDGKPTEFHPGAWFDRFAQSYAYVTKRDDIPSENRARAAINLSLREAGKGDFTSRINEANKTLLKKQDELLKYFMDGSSLREFATESLLLATEIGIEFREMQQVLSRGNSYFRPSDYVDLVMKGELHKVYTCVKEEDGTYDDFLTPGWIPGNHVGGNRVASESSQKMRILLGGRDFRNRNFFEEYIFQKLKGSGINDHGLKFRYCG